MNTPANALWLTAWLDAQREFLKLSGNAGVSSTPVTPQDRLAQFAGDYASIAAAAFAQWHPGNQALQFEAVRMPLVERYRQLFVPNVIAAELSNPAHAAAGAAFARAQRAAERYARLAGAIASDAGRRLGAALATTGPGAPPITSLREFYAVWIDCGEAAWAAAAHSDEFADVQAELLGALVELRAMAPR